MLQASDGFGDFLTADLQGAQQASPGQVHARVCAGDVTPAGLPTCLSVNMNTFSSPNDSFLHRRMSRVIPHKLQLL